MEVFLTVMVMILIVSNVLLWAVAGGLRVMFTTIMNKIVEFAEEEGKE